MEIYPGYYSFVRKENKLWFVNIFFNGLFSFDLTTDTLRYEHCFRNVSREVYLNRYVTEHGGTLYFLPPKGQRILSYDIITKTESVIEVPIRSEDPVILYARRWKDKLAVFPSRSSQGSFMIDLATGKMEEHHKLSGLLHRYGTLSAIEEVIDGEGGTGCFQFVAHDIKKLVTVDLEKEQIFETDIPRVYGDTRYVMTRGEKRYAIVPAFDRPKEFYLWENGGEKAVKYTIGDDLLLDPDKDRIWQIFFRGDKTYILMEHGEVIECEGHGMKKCFDPSEVFFMRNAFRVHAGAFTQLEFVGDEMWCHPCCADRLVIYDLKNGGIRTKKMSMRSSDIPDFDKRMRGKYKRMFSEEGKDGYHLEEFCHAAGQREGHRPDKRSDIGSIIMKNISGTVR